MSFEREENIIKELVKDFPYLEGKFKIQRARRITLETEYKNLREILQYALNKLEFPHLCAITGLDELENLSFIYHLAHNSGILLNIKVSVPKADPVIDTVMELYPGAEIYEREVMDLLGAKVTGLSPGNRYPLTDEWPKDQFPLRKDWKPLEDDVKEADTNA